MSSSHFSCSYLPLICLSTNQNIQLIHSFIIRIEWTTGNGILMSSSYWPIYNKLYPGVAPLFTIQYLSADVSWNISTENCNQSFANVHRQIHNCQQSSSLSTSIMVHTNASLGRSQIRLGIIRLQSSTSHRLQSGPRAQASTGDNFPLKQTELNTDRGPVQ